MPSTQTPSISVVIPFFRRQHTIAMTLESVMAQTLKPLEIIVVDDASGPEALEFLSQFSDHIRLIALEKNGGVSVARNTGVQEAQGEYVAFIDSDDLWAPDKLEKQMNFLRENPECDVVHTGTTAFYLDGTEKSYLDKPLCLSKVDVADASHVMYQSTLMRRDDFIRIGGFDTSFRQTEDWEFTVRMVMNEFKVCFIPEPLVRIRHGHTDKLSLSWKGFIKGHLRVVNKHSALFREVGGPLGPYRYRAKFIVMGGYKRGGMMGRLVRGCGYLMYPTVKVQT